MLEREGNTWPEKASLPSSLQGGSSPTGQRSLKKLPLRLSGAGVPQFFVMTLSLPVDSASSPLDGIQRASDLRCSSGFFGERNHLPITTPNPSCCPGSPSPVLRGGGTVLAGVGRGRLLSSEQGHTPPPAGLLLCFCVWLPMFAAEA